MSAFTDRLGGDWRAVAPTSAQVEAHAGHWWLVGVHGPVLETLSWSDDGSGPTIFVGSTESAYTADEWDAGACDDWRGTALVCPCDRDGVPVPWPT